MIRQKNGCVLCSSNSSFSHWHRSVVVCLYSMPSPSSAEKIHLYFSSPLFSLSSCCYFWLFYCFHRRPEFWLLNKKLARIRNFCHAFVQRKSQIEVFFTSNFSFSTFWIFSELNDIFLFTIFAAWLQRNSFDGKMPFCPFCAWNFICMQH